MVSITATLLTTLLPLIAAQTTTTYPATTLVPAPYQNQTTVYTTVYVDVCPTGLTTKTYTITQTCATPSGALPEHFTTTTKVCDACAGKPTLTVTCPVETAIATATGNVTKVVSVPTGTAGCGSGGNCPAGGNGTVIYVTAGAKGSFATGLEVLVLGTMVGMASSILLL